MWDVIRFILQPGIRCVISGIGILLLPLFWHLRVRGESLPPHFLVPVRWAARLLGVVFVLIGLSLSRTSAIDAVYQGAPLILVGSAGLALADILSRMMVGPVAMKLEPRQLRRFWRGTTSIGIVVVLGGLALQRSWTLLR